MAETAEIVELIDRQASPFTAIWGHELPVVEQEYLIEGWLPKLAYSALFSRRGSGKSFLVVEMAYCGALGIAFLGQPILSRFGSVICIGEKRARFGKRPRAWLEHRGMARQLVPVLHMEGVPNLIDQASVAAFIDFLINDARPRLKAQGVPLEAVFLDTLARCLGGGSVSDPDTVNVALASIERIIREAGVAVIPVAHVAKAAIVSDASMKGAGEWEDAAEAVIRIEREGAAGVRRITNTKQSDGPEAEPLAFTLERVVLGTSRHGREISSCVVMPAKVPDNSKGGRPRSPENAKRVSMVMSAYRCAIEKGAIPIRAAGAEGCKGVKLAEVRALAFDRFNFMGPPPERFTDESEADHEKQVRTWFKSRARGFQRAVEQLRAEGRICVEDDCIWDPPKNRN